jgi:hypothetical protein
MTSPRASRNLAWAALAVVVALALLLYLPVLGFGYVWDDNKIFLVRVTALLQDGITFSGLGNGITSGLFYYRPLVILSFCFDAHVSGFDPGFSHGVNLAIFILNLVLLFQVTRRMCARLGKTSILPAFCATLVYALHPAMTESVIWISGRFDLLVTFFILLALLADLEIQRRALRIAALAGLMLLMVLCKETGVIFPSSILCMWFALHGEKHAGFLAAGRAAAREHLGLMLAFGLVLALYFFLRFQTFGGIEYGRGDYLLDKPLDVVAYRVWLPLETLRFYFFQAFLPFLGTINVQHPLVYETLPWSAADLAGILLALGMLATVVFLAVRRHSPAAWFLIAGLFYLLPVLHIFNIRLVTGWNIGHDRFLATPLVFWAIAIALARHERLLSPSGLARIFQGLPRRSLRNLLWGIAFGWLVLAAFKTSLVVPFWQSDLRLWAWTYALYPQAFPVRQKYLSILIAENRIDLVKAELEDILEKHGEAALEIDYALIRARILLLERDPAALAVFARLLSSAEFQQHEQAAQDAPTPAGRIRNEQARRAVYLYSGYARAILLFERDPQKALRFNEIARWYAQFYRDIVLPELVMNQIAALYVQGHFQEADTLRETLPPERQENMKHALEATLKDFCHDQEDRICQDLIARGTFSRTSPKENILFP